MNKFVIYMYVSPSKKYYIGLTSQPSVRKRQHEQKEYIFTDTTKFAHAIRKYGFSKLKYLEIDGASTIEEAGKKEMYWIKFYDSINSGYNIQIGGSVSQNNTLSDRTIEDVVYLLKHTDLKLKEICDKTGVSMSTVSNVKNGNKRSEGKIKRISHQAQKGENNNQSKLTEKIVKQIKDDLHAGVPRKELQDRYDVSKTLIQQIATNQIWTHIESAYEYQPLELNGNAKLTKEIVSNIKEDFGNNLSTPQISEKYDISQSTVLQIKTGKTWKGVD